MDKHIVSKERVSKHGEVYTREEEVNAMLDLVKQETERIESRFLEPACGTGNFLAEILRRKIRVVESRYKKCQLEYERNAVLAVSSIYGIDLLPDNTEQCRTRLFGIFDQSYIKLFRSTVIDECRNAVKYILSRNIVCGDALTLKTIDDNPQPIIFSEWSPVNSSLLKRRDFSFHGLLEHESMKDLPMFSDLGEDIFIPTPVKEYPLIHFMKVANVEYHKL